MSTVSKRNWRENPLIWPTAGLALVVAFNLFFGAEFFSISIQDGHLYGNLVDILSQGARVMLLSLGMTLVIATGGVDLSVGAVMAIAGALVAALVERAGLGFFVAFPAAMAVSMLLGVFNGSLVVFARIQPIIATLILMVAGRGVAQLITTSDVIIFEDPVLEFMGQGYLLGIPFSLWLVAAIFVGMVLLIRKTAIGLLIEAVGDNENASRFSGINASQLKLIVYGVCGLLAGLAGVLEAASLSAADPIKSGELRELDAIFAVVIGGTALTGGRFLLLGSILGAILLQALTVTLYNVGVPAAVAPVPKAIVIVAVCLLQAPRFRTQISKIVGLRRGK